MEILDEAIKDFTQATKFDKKNPLYHCNKGVAYHANGKRDLALKSFTEAQKLLQKGELAEGLTKENTLFIEKKLDKFLIDLKDLDKIKWNDRILEKRVNDLPRMLLSIVDNEDINEETAIIKIKDTKKIVEWLQSAGNEKLYEYYDGFLFSLTQSYDTAKIVNNGTFVIDTSNLGVSVLSNLVSLIPLVGDYISTAVTGINDFVKNAQVTKAANNVCKFATISSEFEAIAQEAVCEIIMKNEKQIKDLEPEAYILPHWAQRFDSLVKVFYENYQNVQVKLYGERNETDMQKFGYKEACDLIANHIASGDIYEGKPAIHIKPAAKKANIIRLTAALLEQDILDNKKEFVPMKPEEKKECALI
jgi:hypothetical protein